MRAHREAVERNRDGVRGSRQGHRRCDAGQSVGEGDGAGGIGSASYGRRQDDDCRGILASNDGLRQARGTGEFRRDVSKVARGWNQGGFSDVVRDGVCVGADEGCIVRNEVGGYLSGAVGQRGIGRRWAEFGGRKRSWEGDVVQRDPELIHSAAVARAGELRRSRGEEGEVLHQNVFEVRRLGSGCGLVIRTEDDLGLVILVARVGVLHVGDNAATIVSGLDAKASRIAVGGIVDGASNAGGSIAGRHIAVEKDVAHTGTGVAADGFAVSGEEVVVGDGYVRRGSRCAGCADSDIVVSVRDPRAGDGEVCCVARIDAVGVARTGGRNDLDIPGGEVGGGACCGDVEERRIADGDLVEGDIAGAGVDLDEARVLLSAAAIGNGG